MARPIVLSNGEMHVGINKFGLVHDFYYPYVGQENHAAAKSLRHKVGVWVDGEFSWLDDGNWQFTFDYPYRALVGHTTARNEQIGVMIEFEDAVDSAQNAFLRNIHVINLRDEHRDLRLYMHQVFAINDTASRNDTVQFLPEDHAIVHYKGHRVFLVGGLSHVDRPFDEYSVGLFGIEGREGTYRDAEDGHLSGNNVEHGRIDSVIGFHIPLDAHDSARVHYWIAAGKTPQEAHRVNGLIEEEGVLHRTLLTDAWWREWLQRALPYEKKLAPKYRKNFIQSLLILKAHIDKRGAIMASTDTTMLNYSRDAYAYSWPRDGAYAIWPLIRLGYRNEPLHFFNFCRHGLQEGGYLAHKYQADGAIGSSWHPYIHADGIVAPPIQEDETAITLFMFGQYYYTHKDERVLREFYDSLITPMANFMAGWIDPQTSLPKATYDLWEEVFLTTTYTTATVYAGLLTAADLADAMEDADSAVRWRSVANDIADAARKQLYNPERRYFYKGILVRKDGTIEKNDTVDSSSVFGAFMFGLFPFESDEIQESIKTLHEALYVNEQSLGVPRYENDNYHRVDPNHIGNPWFITTLWLAQYYMEVGKMEEGLKYFEWVQNKMMSSGVLSEQLHPFNDSFMSVAPLAWSQAEFVSTLLDMTAEKPYVEEK